VVSNELTNESTSVQKAARGRGKRAGGVGKSANGTKSHDQTTHESGAPRNGHNGAEDKLDRRRLQELLKALSAVGKGDFSVRLSLGRHDDVLEQLAVKINELADRNEAMAQEIVRVEQAVRREGRMTEHAVLNGATGGWRLILGSINSLIGGLVQPTTEVARVISAVAKGDLTQKMALEIDGQPVKGEFLRIGTTVNAMVDQLSSFSAEVTRVAKEVGTDGKLGGQAQVKGASGTWKDLTDNVNVLAGNLTDQGPMRQQEPVL
jgi:methyl-accepting chemotaxis protein